MFREGYKLGRGLGADPSKEVEIGVTDLDCAFPACHADVKIDLPDMNPIPSCYHDLNEVFSKSKATSLPLH